MFCRADFEKRRLEIFYLILKLGSILNYGVHEKKCDFFTFLKLGVSNLMILATFCYQKIAKVLSFPEL